MYKGMEKDIPRKLEPKRAEVTILISVLCLVTQLCLTFCDPMDYSLPGSSVSGDSPGKNTGIGFQVLLQGIFPTQESDPSLLHCRQILYRLSYKGSQGHLPKKMVTPSFVLLLVLTHGIQSA